MVTNAGSAEMMVWLNDRLVLAQDARVSVFDHGFTVADGVFETMKIIRGVPFALTRHLQRLHRSAVSLGLDEPDLEAIRQAIAQTIEANGVTGDEAARLRVTYTAGAGPLGSDRGEGSPTLVVAMTRMQPWPPTAEVITVVWPRNDRGALVGVKSTSYAENVLALAEARRLGASEALMPDTQGRLCEGTGSNVVVVLDGQAITPTLATGALPGITRELALEWLDVKEQDVPIEMLSAADEIWLTSSTRDIQLVHRLDGRDLPTPGGLGLDARRLFEERSSEDLDP